MKMKINDTVGMSGKIGIPTHLKRQPFERWGGEKLFYLFRNAKVIPLPT